MDERRPANLADLLKSRFGTEPVDAPEEARPTLRRDIETPPQSLYSLPNPYLSLDVQDGLRRLPTGEAMTDLVTLRNATRQPMLVGAHFLLPGHTVTLTRAVADLTRKAHPGAFEILNESGVVVSPIQMTTLDEALAAAAAAGGALAAKAGEAIDGAVAADVKHFIETADPGEGGSGFGPAETTEETDNADSSKRPSQAPRKRGAGSSRNA